MSSRIRFIAFVAVTLVVALVPVLSASAQTCTEARPSCGFLSCRSPVAPVPATIYAQGELEPVDTGTLRSGKSASGRDSSMFNEFAESYSSYNWFMGLDTDGQYIYTAQAWGLGVWTPSADGLDHVTRAPFTDWRVFAVGEEKWPLRDLDLAPSGDALIIIGQSGPGVAIFDTTTPSSPILAYQDDHKDGGDVYSAALPGGTYGFAATSSGIRIYNMDRALKYTRCLASTGGCSDVFTGTLQSASAKVHGAGRYLAVANVGGSRGFSVYDVGGLPAIPSAPKLSVTTNDLVYDVAMWFNSALSRYYLAVRFDGRLEIWDVSCVTGSCGSGATKVYTSGSLFNYSEEFFLTHSKTGGRDYLYLGTGNRCGTDRLREVVPEMEYLVDVSQPASARFLDAASGVHQGNPLGYWEWYYRSSPTGFNYIGPRKAIFLGDRLYRAAMSLFDIHQLTGGVAPDAGFTYPAAIYAGTPATFTDTSSGQVDSRSWSFQNGSPSTSSVANPSVTFSTVGVQQVSLTVGNGIGSDSVTKSVTVLDPAPQVSAVTVTPAAPVTCQPVGLQATASGKPALSYSWTILDAQGQSVAGPFAGNPATWNSSGAASGSYRARVTVTNASGSKEGTKDFTLAALNPLPAAGAFTPSNDPFSAGTVRFHVNVPGATEWSWDFEGTGNWTAWSNDPVTGPNPQYSYQTIGQRSVKVRVRNCVQTAAVESAPLVVNVTQIAPLEPKFQASLFCTGLGCPTTVGTNVTFTDQTTGNPDQYFYAWENTSSTTCSGFGGGSATPVTSHTFSTAGTYYPCLKVTRGVEEAQYVHFPAISVSSNSPPPQVSIGINGPSTGQVGGSYSFTASAFNCAPAPSGWSWSLGGGQASGSTTGASVSVSWATAGTKTLTVTNSACGSASGRKVISISGDDGGGGGGTPGTPKAVISFNPSAPKAGETVSFDGSGSTGTGVSYAWSFGDGDTASGVKVTHTYSDPGTYNVILTLRPDGCLSPGCLISANRNLVVLPGDGGGAGVGDNGCSGELAEDETKLCLNNGRFLVSVDFDDPTLGVRDAIPIGYSDRTGFFWFFRPDNVEIIVKILDGGPVNGNWWVFYGGLSNVRYTIRVTDLETNQTKRYDNLPGTICGLADNAAFPQTAPSEASAAPVAVFNALHNLGGGEVEESDELSLLGGRFRVTVEWRDQRTGETGIGHAIPGTDRTGFFWFFRDDNLEMVVKMIDARELFGNFWVFWGGLSDVEYTLTVEDTLTGKVKTYSKAPGEYCGGADTTAFK